MLDIILLFPLTLYSWLFTPAKMSSIILNNIPAHCPGLSFSVHRQRFSAQRFKISIVSCWENTFLSAVTYLQPGQGLTLSLEEVLLLDASKQ